MKQTKYAVSRDGTRIAYEVTGDGPALMLLHGAGRTRRDWQAAGYVDRLKGVYTVISVDLRGAGESDRVSGEPGYAITGFCDDIRAVADDCGVGRFMIWGYSLGGNVARYFAASSPGAGAIAVMGVPLGPAVDEEFDRFIEDFSSKHAHAHSTDRGKASAIKGRLSDLAACFRAMRAWPTIGPADIPCPTLLAAGTRNAGAIAWIRKNRSALDGLGIQVEILDGLTHVQEFTRIDRVFPVVDDFFRSC